MIYEECVIIDNSGASGEGTADVDRPPERDRLNTDGLHHTYSITLHKCIKQDNKPYPES